MDKAIAIIQARMSSSRLPGKVMKKLAGRPLIWHIYQRAKKCIHVDKVIIATSTEQSDDELVEYCKKNNLNVFRGSLNNVMDRFIQILNKENYKYFVRITGDCPLIHPNLIDNQIKALDKYDGDIAWAPTFGSLFEGQGVLSTRLIQTINKKSNDPKDLEHVGSNYIINHPNEFRIVNFKIPKRMIFNNFRLTVDEEEDYKLMQIIYDRLWRGDIIELRDVLKLLLENTDITDINKEIKHKNFNLEVEKTRSTWHSLEKVGEFNYSDNLLD